MKRLLLLLALTFNLLGLEAAVDQLETTIAPVTSYVFKGTHYTAQYYGCDHEAIINRIYLIAYFVKAIDDSGATLLRVDVHPFNSGAITAVALLSESHASVHTYPEHNAVFVDLFTCGNSCDWKKFEKVLSSCLSPKKIKRKVRVRK